MQRTHCNYCEKLIKDGEPRITVYVDIRRMDGHKVNVDAPGLVVDAIGTNGVIDVCESCFKLETFAGYFKRIPDRDWIRVE